MRSYLFPKFSQMVKDFIKPKMSLTKQLKTKIQTSLRLPQTPSKVAKELVLKVRTTQKQHDAKDEGHVS